MIYTYVMVDRGCSLGDWFFSVLSKNSLEESTALSKKLVALSSLLEHMHVPARRKDLKVFNNIRWLARNLAIKNKEHPMFETTQLAVVWVLRNTPK